MDFWQGFAVITAVHLLAAASPGPDFAMWIDNPSAIPMLASNPARRP